MSDQGSGYPGAPPGWYPDPAGGPGQRWWDGYAWNEAVALPDRPPPPPTPPTPPTPPNPPSWGTYYEPATRPLSVGAPLVETELRISPAARLAAAYFGLAFIIGAVEDRLNLSQLRLEGHQLRLVFHAAANNLPAPQFSNTPSVFGHLQWLTLLFSVTAAIVAGIWQFRAATAARALGLPARHSPGWGVVFWYVPVINFWFPYQAISDCLPTDDPNRRVILRWWLLYVAGGVLAAAASLTATFSGSVSLVFSVPTVLLGLAVMSMALKVVPAIGDAHRSLLAQLGAPSSVSG